MTDHSMSQLTKAIALPNTAQHVQRLPWAYCVALMLVGSGFFYGVGFVVVKAFVHLMKVF